MKRLGAVLVLVGLVGVAEGADRTNREFLSWSSNQRAGYVMGAVDATNDWAGLNCPSGANYALAVVYVQQYAERDPNGSVMESLGLALREAGCTTGAPAKRPARNKPTF